VSAVAVFVVCKIVLDLIGKLLTKLAESVKAVGALNTLLGAAIGFVKAAILICAVLAVLSMLPDGASFVIKAQEAIDQTFFVHVIRDNNPLLSWMSKILERAKDSIGSF
ncbi:MAG: CvpA family protein, partial [Candidatus Scatosoma sp.]